MATIQHLEGILRPGSRFEEPVQPLTWWQILFGLKQPKRIDASAPPVIDNDAGWQLIHSEDAEKFENWLARDPDGLPRLKGEEPSLGSHILVEFFDCDSATIELEKSVGEAMMASAKAAECTVVTHDFHEFKPYGVSGAVIIQESHFTIHTWPEHRYAAVDLFYCGGTIYIERAIEVLRDRFGAKRMKFLVVRRGMQSEVEGQ